MKKEICICDKCYTYGIVSIAIAKYTCQIPGWKVVSHLCEFHYEIYKELDVELLEGKGGLVIEEEEDAD